MSSSEKRQRTGFLPAVRCFEEDERAVRAKAHECGMSVGRFMVEAALGRQTKSKLDDHMLNELRRLGGLQKHLFKEGGGQLSKQYAAILVELQAAIGRVAAL